VIRSLYLRNFRNYRELELDFSPKINLISGNNAQGKTNLLEALYFLSTGRSFRTIQLLDLISYSKPFLYIEADFIKDDIAQSLKLSYDGQAKKMHYNSTEYNHFTNLLGLIPTVILAPEDIELIIGSPATRRRLLDIHLAQLDPLYLYHSSRYFKAIKQRNFLLKKKQEASIESWEQIMLTAARYINSKRHQFITNLQPLVQENMLKLSSGKDSLEIRYQPSLTDNYAKTRPKELHIGASMYGPHRDDLIFTINGKEAKSFSSQGQKRCAITALRLAEWQHFADITHSVPILSIDDFGVHLDETRHGLLLEVMQGRGQVFLTSPYPISGIVDRLISIEMGQIRLS
jgi:DNA replication and repair protein RecF